MKKKDKYNFEDEEEKKIDKALYQEFLNGNNEALNTLIRKYRADLIFFINKYTYDYYSAEDISQEAFVYLLQHKEKYDPKYSFKTYLFMIGKSRALNFVNARKKVAYLEDHAEYALKEIDNLEEDYFRSEKNEMVRKHLKLLKREYQLALYFIEYKEWSYKDTALVLGKTMPQTKALIHNARKKLAELLEEEMALRKEGETE